MRRRQTLSGALILLTFVLGARPALAQRYTVEEIVVDTSVQPDGSMEVHERQRRLGVHSRPRGFPHAIRPHWAHDRAATPLRGTG